MTRNWDAHTLNAYAMDSPPVTAPEGFDMKRYRRVSIRGATDFDHSKKTGPLDPVIYIPVDTPGVVP